MSMKSDIDLHAEQLRLEQDMLTRGSHRYRKMLDKKRQKGQEGQTAPGHHLVMESLGATAQAIQRFVVDATGGKPGKRHSALKYIQGQDAHVLAYLTALTCINALALNQPKLTQVAIKLGNEVENEINFSMLSREHPGLHTVVQRQLKKSTSPRHAMTVMRHHVAYAAAAQRLTLNDRDALYLGLKLIELFIEATGLIELVLKHEGARNRLLVIVGKAKIMDWLSRAHESAALFHPVLLPMVVPPRPWTTPRDGGYLTALGRSDMLVRTRNRAYQRELEYADMSQVYASVNAIQATPWKINRPVLEVMRTLWDAGGGVAGLPDRELLEIPEQPALLASDPDYYREHHKDEFYAWKRKRAFIHEANARSVSKRVAASQKITLAEEFAQYPAIWFPCNLDFRGRAYPLPPLLNPQGDDVAKGVLHFAEGVSLGEDGAYWLAVHVANMFGVDKASFEERIAWVHGHEDQILDSALDPLDGQRFWTDAELPFCALAACIEWMGYKVNGNNHISHIPIALDGSCNGLQNFSAMLRDSIGGAATNLVPQAVPADIYTRVRDLAQEKLKARAEEGDAKAVKLDGQLTRAIVKRPVMTLPYGVTQSGMRAQVLEELKGVGLDDWELASYLSKLLWECIGEVVIAARAAMDWLRDASRVASSADLPVGWTTPAGFPVLQDYRATDGIEIRPHVAGKRLKLTVAVEGLKLNRRRQTLGISPNFIHSCDASHMMLTTNLATANGITAFAMIHDSFGTHAGNTSILAAALRQAFVDQYQLDVLADFKQQLEEQLPPEVAEQLPPLPPTGDLDLNLVLESRYFFA